MTTTDPRTRLRVAEAMATLAAHGQWGRLAERYRISACEARDAVSAGLAMRAERERTGPLTPKRQLDIMISHGVVSAASAAVLALAVAEGGEVAAPRGATPEERHLMHGGALVLRGSKWARVTPAALEDIEGEQMAIVRWSHEECPETGTVGWCWWASDQSGAHYWGDAPALAEAKSEAEKAMRWQK